MGSGLAWALALPLLLATMPAAVAGPEGLLILVGDSTTEDPAGVLDAGEAWVTADALGKALGASVKALPDGRVAVCAEEARGLVAADRVRTGPPLLVAAREGAEATGFTATLDAPQRIVRLAPAARHPASPRRAEPGRAIPDFILPRLDGTPLALSSLRGRRILIVNWASW